MVTSPVIVALDSFRRPCRRQKSRVRPASRDRRTPALLFFLLLFLLLFNPSLTLLCLLRAVDRRPLPNQPCAVQREVDHQRSSEHQAVGDHSPLAAIRAVRAVVPAAHVMARVNVVARRLELAE